MSLRVIEDAKQIEAAQQKFAKKLIEKSDKHGKIIVGYPGGNEEGMAYWFSKHRFWYVSKKASDANIPRYWNAFGIRTNENEPEWETKHSHTIICEINPPLSGNTWMVAGVFAKDENGKVYLAHTGKIGGGGEGIGKSAFEENFSGFEQWEYVEGSAGKKRVVILSELDDEHLVSNISYFVREVRRIKDLAKGEKLHKKPQYLFKDFKPEFEGKRQPYTPSQTIQARVTHGRVVNQLAELAQKHGFDNYYNRRVDLYIESGNSKTALIEIKTDTDTESIYKAIGQLLYNAKLSNTQNSMLVAAFPVPIDQELEKILNKLQIQCIWYSEKDAKIVFERINEIFNSLSK